MRNIHSHIERQRKRESGRERWQQMEREKEREDGRKTRGGKVAEDSGQSDGGEERGR